MKFLTSSSNDFRQRWAKTSTWIASISRNAFVVLFFSCVAFAVDGKNVRLHQKNNLKIDVRTLVFHLMEEQLYKM
jgi:hypothetical protein